MDLSKPRLQHYMFAHMFLRDKAFGNPATTVDVLSGDNGSQYLKTLWLTTGLTTKDAKEEFIDAEGIECSPFLIGDGYRGVIVKFPEPLRPTEVFFVAIVVPIDAKSGDKCSCRYFTLELSSDPTNATILGEWNGEMHSNFGYGAPSGQSYFEEVVIALVLNMTYDPWGHERKFEEWVDASWRILEKKNDFLTDDDVDLIWRLSKANEESEFRNFIGQLDKRVGRTSEQVTAENEASQRALDETIKLRMKSTGLSYEEAKMELTIADHDRAYDQALDELSQKTNRSGSPSYNGVSGTALGFDVRKEPVKWSRQLFGGELLRGEHELIKVSRIYIIETLRKLLDVSLAMALWGAIFAAAIVWIGSPWWTGVIFASMIYLFLFVYLSTSRIAQIMKSASLTSLNSESTLLDNSGFIQSIGRNAEWTTKVNKVLEVVWGLGLLAMIPMMWLFFGAVIGIVLSLCSLLFAFLFFLFTAITNTRLFEMAVEKEKAGRLAMVKEAMRREYD